MIETFDNRDDEVDSLLAMTTGTEFVHNGDIVIDVTADGFCVTGSRIGHTCYLETLSRSRESCAIKAVKIVDGICGLRAESPRKVDVITL